MLAVSYQCMRLRGTAKNKTTDCLLIPSMHLTLSEIRVRNSNKSVMCVCVRACAGVSVCVSIRVVYAEDVCVVDKHKRIQKCIMGGDVTTAIDASFVS